MVLKRFSTYLGCGLLAVALAACNGDEEGAASAPPAGNTGGNGNPAVTVQGSASGFVTGFGSVVVDGVHYEDNTASVSREGDDGGASPARQSDLRVGQRVEIEFESGTATAVRVVPELVGRVGAVDLAAGTLTVGGQPVKVNEDAAAGAVTVFEGVSGLAGLQAGDRVEVHGSLQGSGAGALWWATRIERHAADSGIAVRLTGTVANLSADGKEFKLGNTVVVRDDTTVVTPSGLALANGQRVKVFSRRPLDTTNPQAPRLLADAIRIHGQSGAVAVMRVAGVIGRWQSAADFYIDGVHVDASALVARLPAGNLDGTFARVEGRFDATTQLLSAVAIQLAREVPRDAQVEIKGAITDFISADSFKVRNTPVRVVVSGADATRLSGGTVADLRNGAFVELKGSLSAGAGVVVARELTFKTPQSGNQIEVVGSLLARDAAAGTWTLRVRETNYTVRLATTTECEDGCQLATVAVGATVRVEGYLREGVLIAREVRIQLVGTGEREEGGTDSNRPRVIELEGRISVVTETQITIDGRIIRVDRETVVRGGPLAVGRRVEVKVVVLATGGNAGALYAREVEVRRESNATAR